MSRLRTDGRTDTHWKVEQYSAEAESAISYDGSKVLWSLMKKRKGFSYDDYGSWFVDLLIIQYLCLSDGGTLCTKSVTPSRIQENFNVWNYMWVSSLHMAHSLYWYDDIRLGVFFGCSLYDVNSYLFKVHVIIIAVHHYHDSDWPPSTLRQTSSSDCPNGM